ncbi:MAG TPA: AtpZ/AtpI family protein [Planctomycetota bacterium]|nr:AtpZ/AtpI family protein [Planctomycetota bacterium]
MPPEDKESRLREGSASYIKYWQIGFELVVSVVLFTLVGYWLDDRLGTVVLFTLLGLVLGLAGGTYLAYRGLLPGRRSRAARPDAKDSSNPKPTTRRKTVD